MQFSTLDIIIQLPCNAFRWQVDGSSNETDGWIDWPAEQMDQRHSPQSALAFGGFGNRNADHSGHSQLSNNNYEFLLKFMCQFALAQFGLIDCLVFITSTMTMSLVFRLCHSVRLAGWWFELRIASRFRITNAAHAPMLRLSLNGHQLATEQIKWRFCLIEQ